MTEPHDLDELASALLDGTTSPEEDALLDRDPELRAQVSARAEELRAVPRALAASVPVDEARRDTAIAAALAAFDEDAPPDSVAGATVTPLAPRRGLSPRAVRALSAAAVVLLLALLVPLLANVDRGDDDEASFDPTGAAIEGTGGLTTVDAADEEGAFRPEADGGGSGAVTGDAPATQQLGSYEDLDALAAAVATTRQQRGVDAGANPESGPPRCPPPTSSASLVLLAVVDGRAVEVYVEDGTDGPRRMTVLARDTCAVLDQREL